MKKNNIMTVEVKATSKGYLEASIQQGILVSSKDEVIGFDQRINGHTVRWKDKLGQGVVEGGRLISAGFYLKKKEYKPKRGEYPFFVNIGQPHKNGHSTDLEIFLKVGLKAKFEIFSAIDTKTDIVCDCINFPKNPKEYAGEILLRIPDGSFLRVSTERFGCICLLNVGGKLTWHPGRFPNPNTKEKAIEAAKLRDSSLGFFQCLQENLSQDDLESEVELATSEEIKNLVQLFDDRQKVG